MNGLGLLIIYGLIGIAIWLFQIYTKERYCVCYKSPYVEGFTIGGKYLIENEEKHHYHLRDDNNKLTVVLKDNFFEIKTK